MSRALVLFAGWTLGLLAPLSQAGAAGSPAVPVPSDRWGTLQPAGILGDSTRFEGHSEPVRGNVREYHDVDIENGFLFAATGQGLVVYNLQQNPVPTGGGAYIFGYFDGSGSFPVWQHSDKDWYIKEVDAPAGVDSVVALGMEEQGFAVVNSANKNGLIVAYQGALDVSRVYAFTSGSTHFAYAIERSGGRIHRFSLSAASGMTKCVETPPAVSCPGVYLKDVAGFGTGNRDIQGMDGFVVTSRMGSSGFTRIYSIADPAAPALRLEIPGGTLSAVIWPQGGSWRLARLAQTGQITIHDVSCISGGACSAAPVLATVVPATPQVYLKLSVDGGRPYLYVGNDDLGTCAPQREFLYDLGNPAAPSELTPKTSPLGYWGWYYMNCPTGFNLIGPRRARVWNGILYRAAYNLLDAHRLQTGPVPARVDGVNASPAAPRVCQPVTFTAVNAVGTPPLTYAWVLDSGGTPVPGVGSATGTLVWNTAATTPPGTYKATVTVTNALGTDSKSATVTLSALPALPAPGSFAPTVDPFTGSTVPFHVSVAGATAWNWDFDGNGVFNEADWTSDPVAGPNPTFTYSSAGARQVKVKVRNCVSPVGVVSAAVAVNVAGGKIVVNGPDFGQPGQALQFAGVGVDGCSPPPDSGWTWSAQGGALSGQTTGTVTITWTTLGNKTVTAKSSACPGLTGTRTVRINPKLDACFSSSPPLKLATQPVSFDAACSVGSPGGYTWDFGDHTPFGSGPQVTHAFATPGTYQVTLSVTRPGSDCPPAPFCESSRSQLIEVGPIKPALVAKFAASAEETFTGQPVTFTDQSEGGPTSWTWDFGDGATGTGATVSHAYSKADTFTVKLTIAREGGAPDDTAMASTAVRVIRPASAVVVPWVARSRGASVQTSDLYVHNPGPAPMTVTLEFRRRGLPETSPPTAVRTIAPGATLYAADCIKSLFGRDESLSGFVLARPAAGSPQPVVTSIQTTGSGASAYGAAVQGVPVDAPPGLFLAGMNDGSRRTAFFGISNPNDAPATYRLRFFNKAGQPIGNPGADLTVSRLGQRQFQLAEIRSQLGVKDQDDYRIAIESASPGLFPFGVNTWTSTSDPSLAAGGPRSGSRLYVIGALNKSGAGDAWKTDLVLANPAAQAAPVRLTFVAVGAASAPTAPVAVSVAAGATERVVDVLDRWSLKNTAGVLTIDPGTAGGTLPSALGESYRSPLLGGKRYGHALPVLADGDAAAAGQAQVLAGLRQNAASKTTVWVFNPGPEVGEYDVIYRGLDGAELGRIGVRLGGGRARQLSPPQHPLPEAGTPDGFTVEVRVRAGRALAAAQVVSGNGDSAYLVGTTSAKAGD
ncbi:MAG: PKD domain-containing protein [Acidobacteriota bacterium]